ncbi:hypothetical protein [Chishuiella changwenlii]|uniref:hypothetical protein n=1 Tax=Chishuiella changwenlii TaxID=1434701 RepID=UPI002FDA881D
MKLLIFIICLFPVIGKSQSKADTIFFEKSANNKIYLDNDYQKVFLNNSDKNKENYFPLYSYKSKYYLYKSCDSYNDKNILIKRNSVIVNMGETQYFNIVKRSRNITSFDLTNEDFKTKMEVKKVNRNTNIIKLNNLYFLVTNANKMKNFPIIVNDCKNEKVDEFKFDDLDLKTLFESIK